MHGLHPSTVRACVADGKGTSVAVGVPSGPTQARDAEGVLLNGQDTSADPLLAGVLSTRVMHERPASDAKMGGAGGRPVMLHHACTRRPGERVTLPPPVLPLNLAETHLRRIVEAACRDGAERGTHSVRHGACEDVVRILQRRAQVELLATAVVAAKTILPRRAKSCLRRQQGRRRRRKLQQWGSEGLTTAVSPRHPHILSP